MAWASEQEIYPGDGVFIFSGGQRLKMPCRPLSPSHMARASSTENTIHLA